MLLSLTDVNDADAGTVKCLILGYEDPASMTIEVKCTLLLAVLYLIVF